MKSTTMDKLIQKGFLIYSGLLLIFLVYLWQDDSLTPLSRSILEYKPEPVLEDNGQIYLWCFACEVEDVYAEALKTVAKIQQATALDQYLETYTDASYYTFDDESLLCTKFESDCDVFQLAQSVEPENYNTTYAWAIERYQTYLNFQNYVEQTAFYMDSPIPEYKNLINAQKVFHIKLLIDSKPDGQLMHAALTEELIKLKKILAQSHLLISKIITATMIGENLEMVNQLIQSEMLEVKDLDAYQNALLLNHAHFDLCETMKIEYVMHVHFLIENDFSGKFIKKDANWYKKFVGEIIYKLIYKKNMAINFITSDFENLIPMCQMDAQEFAKFIKTPKEKKKINRLRNYLGHKIFNDLPMPQFYDYFARIHSLHNKMILLKSIMNTGSKKIIENKMTSGVTNLYNNEPPYVEDQQYCFSGIKDLQYRPQDICLKLL